MTVAGFVLVCALDLLGRSASQFPPIILLDERPPDASSNAVAFVRRGENAIYLISSATAFQKALESNRHKTECRNLDALRLVASIIIHEEWHLKNGSGERDAYFAQLNTLQQLGAGPGRWPYETVRRAMQSTLAREERLSDARRLIARATASASASLSGALPSDPASLPVAPEWMRPAIRPR
jgi:hypothetical protein